MYTIYKATCIVTGKSYIGCTSNFYNRKAFHKFTAKNGPDDSKFYKDMREHGFESFSWEIICEEDDEYYAFNVVEPFFISYYNTYDSGYNSVFGGQGCSGLVLSDESKKKISQGNKVPKPQTAEHIRTRVETNKRKYGDMAFKHMLGKTHSPESIEKMSLAQKGKPKSELHKASMIGRPQNKVIATCPHCNKTGQSMNMKRWHFDNCKSLKSD